MTTVRAATFEVMRRQGMTTIFSNPGSTEVAFLGDLPDDLRFVLALHEGSVVGIASGCAIATTEPAFVLLHTTAGLGNAVGAIATARVNRAPLVVVVGQQDRRHLALEPFLAGRLEGMAGDYPLEVCSPVRAQDVPSAIERAAHTARYGQGPALVVVPMDDWSAVADRDADAAPARALAHHPTTPDVSDLTALIEASMDPVIVAGSGNDSPDGWQSLVALAERLHASVWQEAFGARAGFPQDHRLFAGHLPADRPRAREMLDGHDLVLVVGTAALRQYPYAEGPIVPERARLVVVTADPAEAHRSPAELAIVGEPAQVIARVLDGVEARESPAKAERRTRAAEPVCEPGPGEPLRAAHIFERLAASLSPEVALVEESPSSRQLLQTMVPAQRPLGFLSAAMGGLGFAMPAAIGLKMAQPNRPVVAVVGDGSALYAIQSLWTAAHLDIGVLFVVMANGGYAVMDRLAEHSGGKSPWPAFGEISVCGIASSLGCPVTTVETYDELSHVVAETASTLYDPHGPMLIEARVAPDETFEP